jgi:hypothetical protein
MLKALKKGIPLVYVIGGTQYLAFPLVNSETLKPNRHLPMMQTFTLCPEKALETSEKPARDQVLREEPSAGVIAAILNFSRNLEVYPSAMLEHVNYLKS